jgi:hypothetical protein
MSLKKFAEKIYTNPLYIILTIVAALITIIGGIKITKHVTTAPDRPSLTSSIEIFYALPLNQLIDFDKKTKDFYRFECPDFNSNAREQFSWLKECVLLKFGALGSFNGKNFYFGTYNFSKDFNYINEGIIVFEGWNNSDFIEPVIFRVHLDILPKSPMLGYSEPRIFNTKYGPILNVSCALGGGSAIAYDFQYFLWNGSKWILLDNQSWMDQLVDKLLLKGLTIYNDEPIDLNNLVYTSYLWKLRVDPHCCPTGGRVKVYLKIQQYRFVIDSLTFLD